MIVLRLSAKGGVMGMESQKPWKPRVLLDSETLGASILAPSRSGKWTNRWAWARLLGLAAQSRTHLELGSKARTECYLLPAWLKQEKGNGKEALPSNLPWFPTCS